jgi:Na+-transporting NADH:ubiquinone oxidoreductase subunit A
MIKITRGLDLPIEGAPALSVEDGAQLHSVALIGFDYVGMRPTMSVQVGDKVAKGQVLFSDKKNLGVLYTSPASGVVKEINRGAQRVFQSIVIELQGDDEVTFESYAASELFQLNRQQVVDNLVQSGLWTALRTRPFSKVPAIDSTPASIFVNVMDTNPLAFDPMLVVNEQQDDFIAGLDVLSRLAPVVHVCHTQGALIPKPRAENVKQNAFSGVHPAGLSGTHIHFVDPVSENKTAWTINYQDVIAVGKLFVTGKLVLERVISLAGPSVLKPKIIRTLLGANLANLTAGELCAGDNRIVSGSVLSGRHSAGVLGYLGRYHLQVSVLVEGRHRDFMGWFSPGINRFSNMNIYLSKFMPTKKFSFTTNTNGSPRAIVPIGTYETVMPLDILPTHLLRALVVGDIDMAVKLGALELDEEDLALCTFVCPGKYEYGAILRDNLTHIEQEG